MKFLLIVCAVMAGVWWLKQPRQNQSTGTARQTPAIPQAMVACAVCGLHVPQAEATAGRQGWYCGAEHRRRAEG